MFTEEEFLKALSELTPIVAEPIEYRIYYDGQGDITSCSMQNHPACGQYLVVDQIIYENYFKYRVNIVRSRLEKIDIIYGISVQLKKSDCGHAVVKNHAGLLLETDEQYTDIEYYDTTD